MPLSLYRFSKDVKFYFQDQQLDFVGLVFLEGEKFVFLEMSSDSARRFSCYFVERADGSVLQNFCGSLLLNDQEIKCNIRASKLFYIY